MNGDRWYRGIYYDFSMVVRGYWLRVRGRVFHGYLLVAEIFTEPAPTIKYCTP
jgi:hypothetical protein